MTRRLTLTLVALAALAAQPPDAGDAEARLRAAESAWRVGDDGAAGALYEAAAERSGDPGLIAFNLGAIHFRKEEFREAELDYNRALDDGEAPAGRRARALYNRGVCLVRRGGLAQFRTAIDSFERSLAAAGADAELTRDAEHNLELAKMLWLEARAKSQAPPRPNEPPAESPPEAKPPPKPDTGGNTTSEENPADRNAKANPSGIDPVTGQPKAPNATGTRKTVGGRGNLPVNAEWAGWRPKDGDEAREYLKRLGVRLAKDRRDLTDTTAPPEQPHVKDW